MNNLMLLLLMIFVHIMDDFHLQGCLSNLKQKEWWKRQDGYKPLYKYDYIISLIIHSIQWSIAISIPLLYFKMNLNCSTSMLLIVIINAIVHAIVDDAKCNRFKINLIEDQLIHLVQIILTWVQVIHIGVLC